MQATDLLTREDRILRLQTDLDRSQADLHQAQQQAAEAREQAQHAQEGHAFFATNALESASDIIEIVQATTARKTGSGRGSSATTTCCFPSGTHSASFRLNKISLKDGTGLFFIMKCETVTFSFQRREGKIFGPDGW